MACPSPPVDHSDLAFSFFLRSASCKERGSVSVQLQQQFVLVVKLQEIIQNNSAGWCVDVIEEI
jgi:hypothetical protein